MGENPLLSDPDVNHVRHCLEEAGIPGRAGHLPDRDGRAGRRGAARRHRLPKRTAPLPAPTGACSACARRSSRLASPSPTGRSSASWRNRWAPRALSFDSPREMMDEIASVTPIYGGVTYERLEEVGSLQWPVPTADHPGTPYLHKGRFSRGLGPFPRHRVHGGRKSCPTTSIPSS